MLEIYDRDRRKVAILQNAFGVRETVKINAVSYLWFSLPENDAKTQYCQKHNLARYNGGEFYRITADDSEEQETGKVTYECEHLIALLIDTCIPDFVNVGGMGYFTAAAINHVLGRQLAKHWVLDECDFARQFEYGWDKENLLAALFSIPNRFSEDYIWVYNTSVYPYRVSLKRLDTARLPDHYVRRGHNRLQLVRRTDSKYLCTRLYPFGAGEGVNQVSIANVNNGVRFLQSPPDYIARYGLIEKIWVDRRYTDETSLLDAARVMLGELQEPYVEYETEIAGRPKVGEIVQIVGGIKSVVVETDTAFGEVPQVTARIANRPQDIAGTVADLADRQRIEMTYSQGATQIYADSTAENGDAQTPVELRFYLPDSMININGVNCKIRLSSFRAYTANVISGGATRTSSSGGATTSSSGGGATTSAGGGATTDAGGGITTTSGTSSAISTTSSSGGGGTSRASGATRVITGPTVPFGNTHYHDVGLGIHYHGIDDHTHQFWLPGHSHRIELENHTHRIASHTHTIGNHTHTIGDHTHTVDTTHTHDITPKITFYGNPSGFWLFVNGERKQNFNSRDAELDITQYLVDAKERRIKRGTWHVIGVQPNDLARVEIGYNILGFIQSRGNITV